MEEVQRLRATARSMRSGKSSVFLGPELLDAAAVELERLQAIERRYGWIRDQKAFTFRTKSESMHRADWVMSEDLDEWIDSMTCLPSADKDECDPYAGLPVDFFGG